MDYRLYFVARSDGLKLKRLKMDMFLAITQLFASKDVN